MCSMVKSASNTWFYAQSKEKQTYMLNKAKVTKEPTKEDIYKIYLANAFDI